DRAELEAIAPHDFVEEPKRPTVDVFHVDDVVTGAEQEQERGLGSKPGGEGQAVPCVLESRETFFECLPGRIARARVLETLVPAHALLREGGGQVDRLNYRARRRVGPLAYMQGPRGKPPVLGPVLRQVQPWPRCATNSSR